MNYGGGGYVPHFLCRTRTREATAMANSRADTTTTPTRDSMEEATNPATINTATSPTRATSTSRTAVVAAPAGTVVPVWERSAASAASPTVSFDLSHYLSYVSCKSTAITQPAVPKKVLSYQ